MTRIYTIGHSNHSLERLFELLSLHGIEVVVDVRSRPYSRHVPHFSRQPLQQELQRRGMTYIFMGKQLGGMGVDFDDRPHDPGFRTEIDRLLIIAGEKMVALLCAEEDPVRCHRHMLLEPVLTGRGVEVAHIRQDGRLLKDMDDARQLGLFNKDGSR